MMFLCKLNSYVYPLFKVFSFLGACEVYNMYDVNHFALENDHVGEQKKQKTKSTQF